MRGDCSLKDVCIYCTNTWTEHMIDHVNYCDICERPLHLCICVKVKVIYKLQFLLKMKQFVSNNYSDRGGIVSVNVL